MLYLKLAWRNIWRNKRRTLIMMASVVMAVLLSAVMGSMQQVILIPQVSHSLSDNLDFLLLAQLLKGSVFTDITETPNLLFFRLKWAY